MQQGALRAFLLAAAVAATSWHAGYAFSPMGPLPSLSRLGPRGGAGSPGLQMSAEQSGQPQAVEETRADRPGASKPVGSKRAWLKRKVLAGSALLSVSLSTPQPSGAFDLSEHAGACAPTATQALGGAVQAHVIVITLDGRYVIAHHGSRSASPAPEYLGDNFGSPV